MLEQEDLDATLNDIHSISNDTSKILVKILNWAKTQNADFKVKSEQVYLERNARTNYSQTTSSGQGE